jgi:hypothetical protein
VFPDERVRETLRLMERPADEPVTRGVARDIAQREQLKALVTGSIVKLGTQYVLAIEAINAGTGDVIAREQAEAASQERVLTELGTAVSRLREKLGESLTSVNRFDVPLARATTSSLDALARVLLALDEGEPFPGRGDPASASRHRARSQLRPCTGDAVAPYSNTGAGRGTAHARRAFELRDRVSERERFFISWRYYIDALQAWDKAWSWRSRGRRRIRARHSRSTVSGWRWACSASTRKRLRRSGTPSSWIRDSCRRTEISPAR